MNHRPVLKIVVASFGLIAVTLSAIQCGTSHSEEQVQKRAQSPAPILLQQAFEKASEEHDLDLLEQVALVQARMGDISSALRTIGSAKLVGWRDRRFADLSKALSARGDIAGAIKVASAIDASSWGKKETLSEIGQAQANAGDISNATKTAGELPGYLRADVLQAIALRQVENDNIQDAFKTLASIDLPGDVVRRSRVLIAIAVRQTDANRLADALHTVALLDGEWKATALGEVAQSLARQKQFIRASKMAGSIENDSYTKALTFANVAQTRETLGDKSGGEKDRYQAVQIASSIPNAEYRDLALRAISESAAESHDWASALQVASQVTDVSHRILALTSLAVAQKASGLRDASATTVASANEVSRSSNDPRAAADNASYWIVAMNARVGDLPAAIAAASRLADSKDINQCLAFSELAFAQGAAGDAKGAVTSLKSIHVENPSGLISCTKEGSRSDAVEAAVRARHLDAAVQIAKAGPEQCETDRSIASGLVRVGDGHGSAKWTYTRGSKVMEGCALVGMAEGILNRNGSMR